MIAPSKFDVYFVVENQNKESIKTGKVTLDVTCRIEPSREGQDVLKYTGSLISFEVKEKKAKK